VVDIDDLVGAGAIGLMDAVTRFEPGRAQTFAAYAEIRIRGAILDHLRAMDWLPRSVRTKARRVDEAKRTLKNELGRTPETREVAEALGVSERVVASVEAGTGAVVSVEDVRSDGFEGFLTEAPAPGQALADRQRTARLAAAIARLPARIRQLLSLYYVEELTLKQIGTVFGITESRACQLHGQAVQKLKSELLDDADLQ
jgi:RNA polymerase sigma factor for flagellar operon FliA